jgi:DNA-binding NarL/FixJ family response regulator
VLRSLERLACSAGPAPLTAREAEVLGLVAEGLSNREIAARLFISANTAANHVRSILMKTGTANRTQAARYATDHELA